METSNQSAPTVHRPARLAAVTALVLALLAAVLPAYALSNGQAASLVLGQANFTTGTANTGGRSASTMSAPRGVAVDPTTGKVFVADASNNRVLRFADYAALTSGGAAEAVLGQASFTAFAAATSQSGMEDPRGVAVDSAGRLWVADYGNHRVLRFDAAASKANGANADGVLGQANFTSGSPNRSGNPFTNPAANTLDSPYGVALDANGRLWVADSGNHRVLRYDAAASKTNGANADGVLGQTNFTNDDLNTTQAGMRVPTGVAVDSADRLWVADSDNRRVLRFDTPASGSGINANGVLGQANFTSRTTATTQAGMNTPTGVAVDANGRLWVADTTNNRVLYFEAAASKANGGPADGVLGQAIFTTSTQATTQAGMRGPVGLAVDGIGRLWVGDTTNNRVLAHDVRAAQTITFGVIADKTILDVPFTVSATASSALPVTFSSATPLVCTVSGDLVTLLDLGTCTIAADQAGDVAFMPAPQVAQSFAVTLAPQVITFDPLPAKTYGDPAFDLSATGGASGNPVTFTATGACSVAGVTVTIAGAGACDIVADQAGAGSYSAAAPVTQTLTIAQKELSVTVQDVTRRVGTPNPAFTLLYSGFVGADDASVLDTPPTASTSADATSPIGTYPITLSGGLDANYTFLYTDGTLTVTEKDIPVITWASPAAITYGTPLGASQLNASATVNGQPVAGTFTYSPAAGTVLSAGSGQVLSVTFTPDAPASYETVTAQVQIDVARAPLTITAENKTMVAGGAVPALSARYSGFVNGDTAASLDVPVTLTTAATSASAAGTYPIVASGAADANYTISFVAGTLTVVPAAQTDRLVYFPVIQR